MEIESKFSEVFLLSKELGDLSEQAGSQGVSVELDDQLYEYFITSELGRTSLDMILFQYFNLLGRKSS